MEHSGFSLYQSFPVEATDDEDKERLAQYIARAPISNRKLSYDQEKDVFRTVCKLGSGFSDEDLASLPEVMAQYVLDHPHPRVDSKLQADFWFVPTKVLEVRGAELTLSPLHTCGWGMIRKDSGIAIRFPRFTGKWRDDRRPEDATTVKELVEMYQSQLKRVKT